MQFQAPESQVPPGGPAVLTFGEAVTGITANSIPIRPFDPDSPPGTEPVAPIPGNVADLNPEHTLDVTDLAGNPPPSYSAPAFHVGTP